MTWPPKFSLCTVHWTHPAKTDHWDWPLWSPLEVCETSLSLSVFTFLLATTQFSQNLTVTQLKLNQVFHFHESYCFSYQLKVGKVSTLCKIKKNNQKRLTSLCRSWKDKWWLDWYNEFFDILLKHTKKCYNWRSF